MASCNSYDSYRPSSSSPPRYLTNGHSKRPAPEGPSPLPLSEEAKVTIDTLKTAYKKRGHFDALRKDIYQRLTESEVKKTFVLSIEKTSNAEISRDPSLLARDKNKAAELIERTVVRGDVYGDVEKVVDGILAERRTEIEDMIKTIMEENGVPLLLEAEGGRDKEKEKEDADMQELKLKQEDNEKEEEKEEEEKKGTSPVGEGKTEDLSIKRSRFDDAIGLHLKDREKTTDSAPAPAIAVANV